MDKNKDPAFLFYSSDFLTGTMFMSDEQVGKYIRLMCAQHQKGHLKEKDMLNICKTYDEDIYTKFVKDDDGNYYNARLDKEIVKRSKYSESRRNNRLSRSKEGEKKEEHMNNICQSYEEHMENENENINEDINITNKPTKKDIDNLFEELWKVYPIKKGKGSVTDATKKNLYSIGIEEMTRTIQRYVKEKEAENTERKYWKHGSTFFYSGYVDYLDSNYEEPTKEGESANTSNNTRNEKEVGGNEQSAYDYDKFFS